MLLIYRMNNNDPAWSNAIAVLAQLFRQVNSGYCEGKICCDGIFKRDNIM